MTCFSPDGGRTLAIFLILCGWGVSSSDGSSELYSGSSSSLISSDKFEGLETADSNAEQLLNIYMTFIYVGGELQQPFRGHGFLSVFSETSTGKSTQRTDWRSSVRVYCMYLPPYRYSIKASVTNTYTNGDQIIGQVCSLESDGDWHELEN